MLTKTVPVFLVTPFLTWFHPFQSITQMNTWQGVRSGVQLSCKETRFWKCSQSVKKRCCRPLLKFIYDILCDFMHKMTRNTPNTKIADFITYVTWTHHNISLRFRVTAQRVNNFRFCHWYLCLAAKKNWRPIARSISLPLTFHIAILNRFTPNQSKVTQKLTL